MSSDEIDIGRRIAQFREERELSQSALAKQMGSSQSAISQIEAGERNPSFETLRQIAKALGMTPAMLVGADPALEAHELAHFRTLRSLSPAAQQELQQFAAFLQMKQKTKPAE
jgi:transcriptional regulator with XRE-family HTH domain